MKMCSAQRHDVSNTLRGYRSLGREGSTRDTSMAHLIATTALGPEASAFALGRMGEERPTPTWAVELEALSYLRIPLNSVARQVPSEE